MTLCVSLRYLGSNIVLYAYMIFMERCDFFLRLQNLPRERGMKKY